MILGFTGHRPDRLGGYDQDTWSSLVKFATEIMERKDPSSAVIGMALGWDLAVASACAILKVPFVAAVPFHGQEKTWPPESQRLYRLLLSQSKETVLVNSGQYARWKLLRRNEWMVNRSDEMVALWDGEQKGGTFQCVMYARKKGKKVSNVWPEWRARHAS